MHENEWLSTEPDGGENWELETSQWGQLGKLMKFTGRVCIEIKSQKLKFGRGNIIIYFLLRKLKTKKSEKTREERA